MVTLRTEYNVEFNAVKIRYALKKQRTEIQIVDVIDSET